MNNMQNKTSSVKKLKMHALSILRMSHLFHKSNDVAPIPSMLNQNFISENQIQIDNGENFEEQQEFSFPNFGAQGTLTFADEIFDNGKIRPKSTTFDQSLVFTTVQDNDTLHLQPPLKKLFVDKELNGFSSQQKKSKSTGFSNTWRLREDIKLRSISDGKDAFVLLNPSGSMPMKSNEAKEEIVVSKRKKGEKRKTTFSPHEKIYVMNKKRKETNKRKSFLPYRQNLIGVFSNVNGFSRILSPF
ncbi:hypothetical protein JHK82_022849 [Glycine max]|nr:hypothetical protein JHK82_022849 [Glycine max]